MKIKAFEIKESEFNNVNFNKDLAMMISSLAESGDDFFEAQAKEMLQAIGLCLSRAEPKSAVDLKDTVSMMHKESRLKRLALEHDVNDIADIEAINSIHRYHQGTIKMRHGAIYAIEKKMEKPVLLFRFDGARKINDKPFVDVTLYYGSWEAPITNMGVNVEAIQAELESFFGNVAWDVDSIEGAAKDIEYAAQCFWNLNWRNSEANHI